ncbi:MAG: putative glycosyl transferase [Moraxellaceae bacterium]|jgi:glycosyltransferase involved in cell wall biosynthesis|nr:putative glycosyl transferase [Moraxellaceae bacterium]MDF3031446.1 putative glycosyl transferase [Moraxellaceae bacterium]
MDVRPHDFSISCVVPVHNEAANIPAFIPALHAALAGLSRRFEIIAVNDGSTDGSGTLLRELASRYGLCLIDFSRNFGKEAALTAGIDCARGDVVILIDADFQHPLELLPVMIGKWREGHDMVYGLRNGRDGESWLRRHATAFFYYLINRGSSVDIPMNAGDFRLMDRCVVEALKALPERTRFMKGLYAWVGFDSVAVPFHVQERQGGTSSFGLASLTRLALTGLFSFSDLPLRIWSTLGFLVAFGALLHGLWLLEEVWLDGVKVPGWATLAVSLMFFSGVQLISVGILGEYLARVFSEVKQRPNYIVARREDRSPLAVQKEAEARLQRRA